MSTSNPVIAIATSDIHLSVKPPLARADEKDWYAAMARPLEAIKKLQKKLNCVVLCAGDLFDKWNAPAELINWAIDNLPDRMLTIPGNHDLPNHRHELWERSAYGTLVKAGKILMVTKPSVQYHLKPRGGYIRWVLRALQPGEDARNSEYTCRGELQVAMLHDYLWTAGKGYTGAPLEQRIDKVCKRFDSLGVVVVGDNHMGFRRRLKGGTRVVNCGTPIRRKSNEADYAPRVWLIRASGRVTSVRLSTTDDVLTRTVTESQEDVYDADGIEDFIEGLAKMEASGLNYRETVLAAMKKFRVPPATRDVLLEAMG